MHAWTLFQDKTLKGVTKKILVVFLGGGQNQFAKLSNQTVVFSLTALYNSSGRGDGAFSYSICLSSPSSVMVTPPYGEKGSSGAKNS